ncbi:MAG: hypothetical protein AAF492_10470 [Verrucomicrobiota bacterium]
MKWSISIFLAILIGVSARANILGGRDFNQQKYDKLLDESEVVFEGTVEVIKREYRNKEGFRIDPETFSKDIPEETHPELFWAVNKIYTIHYKVRFKPTQVIKNSDAELSTIECVTTARGLTSMCPSHPPTFAHGGTFIFFINEVREGIMPTMKLMHLKKRK